MKRILCIATLLILLLLVVSPAGAIRDNFQNYNVNNYHTDSNNPAYYYPTATFVNQVTGEISAQTNSQGNNLINYVATPWTYLAFDCTDDSYAATVFALDSVGRTLFYFTPNAPKGARIEIKILGGTPTLFINGVKTSTQPIISVNPSYVEIYSYVYMADNIVFGEADNHVVAALPSNWTVIRDFINPSSTGVYAGYNTTSLTPWVLKNSYTMYIDADVDSTDGVTYETLNIANVQSGNIVNTTVVDSTIPRHQIAYNLTNFLAAGPTTIPDGQYKVYYTGSTVTDYFWLISQGGWLNFDRSTYNIGDNGTLSWYLSSSYIDLADYEYTYQIVDVYGNVKASGVTATTPADTQGTVPITFSTNNGYSQGAYYGEMIATGKTGTPYQGTVHVMGVTAITLTQYLAFYGYAYNASSTLALNGAIINFTQLGTSQVQVTAADGNYSVNGLTTGGAVYINVSKTGFQPYNYNFIPTATGNKSLDFAIAPANLSLSGSSIGGVFRDKTYGNLIPYATVYIWNTTTSEFNTKTANIRGFYYCDNSVGCYLTSKRLYNVQGNLTGYSPSAIYQVVAP
jgi:hypothetical protein